MTVRQDSAVQAYLKDLGTAADGTERANLLENLTHTVYARTQQSVLQQTGDYDGGYKAFRDTLKDFASGQNNLGALLTERGLDAAKNEQDNAVMAYVARELKRERNAEYRERGFSAKENKYIVKNKYLDKDLDKMIEDIKEGKEGKQLLYMGKLTGNGPYEQIGIPPGNLYMHKNIGYKSVIGKHSDHLEEADLRRICDMLDSPMLIARYRDNGKLVDNVVSIFVDFKSASKPLVIGMRIKWNSNTGAWHEVIPTMHIRGDVGKFAQDALWVNPKLKNDPKSAPWLPVAMRRYAASANGVITTITYRNEAVNQEKKSLKDTDTMDFFAEMSGDEYVRDAGKLINRLEEMRKQTDFKIKRKAATIVATSLGGP